MVKTTCRNSQWASEEGRKRTKVTVKVVSMVVGVVELTEDGLKNECFAVICNCVWWKISHTDWLETIERKNHWLEPTSAE